MDNVLVAASLSGYEFIQSLLEGYPLIPAFTIDDALEALRHRSDIALVFCAVMFDDSRMFDFLRAATARHSSIPIVCVRAIDSSLPASSLNLEVVTQNAGAVAFVDVPRLVKENGKAGARLELERLLRPLIQ